jgi:FdhD protein
MSDAAIQLHDVRRREADGRWSERADRLTVEEPLELRIGGRPFVAIMRTPGDDEALARGFLLTEGVARNIDDIRRIERAVDREGRPEPNALEIELSEGAPFDPAEQERRFFASSSCGICGKASIEQVVRRAAPLKGDWRIDARVALALPEKLRARQPLFDATGSLHAAGLFDLRGEAIESAEDVGRHNAVDKAIGRAAARGLLPLDGALLAVSGRISFEIAQKALMAGVAAIVAVSGASSLAVALAEDQGMTLAGFVRDGAMTVYHGAWRFES